MHIATQQQQRQSSLLLLSTTATNSKLHLVLGRVYLQSGQISEAEAHFAIMVADTSIPKPTKVLNAASMASVHRDWDAAGGVLHGLIRKDNVNYAVCSIIHAFICHHVAKGDV
jgi:hypothetical protein